MGIIAKQSVRGTVWTYVGVLIGLITVFFVQTRFLSAEEIGLARVMIDAATLFIGLAQLGTSSSIIRFFPYFSQPTKSDLQTTTSDSDHRSTTSDPYHGFFFWAIVVPLIGFVLFAVVYWACKAPISQYFEAKSPLFVNYYYFVLPLAFFMLYQMVFETCSNVLMHTVFPRAVVRECLVRVMLLVLYLMYAFGILTLDGFVIGLCVLYMIAALCNVLYVFLTEHISLRPDFSFLTKPLVRRYLLYTGFLILSATVTVFSPLLSSFMVTAEMGLKYTGIFAIATYISVMISIPSRSMMAIAQPQLSLAIKNNNQAESSLLIRQVSTNLLLVGSLIFAAIWINIDLIYAILPNGSTYAEARQTVFYLSLTQLLITTFSFLLFAINYSSHYYLSLILSLLLTIGLICLNNYLIPRYGMDGAALSMLIGNAAYFLLMMVAVRFVLKLKVLTLNHLKIGVVFLVLFVLNQLWLKWLTPIISVLWVDSLLRTIILLIPTCWIAYRFKFSAEINAAIANTISKLKKH